MYVNNFYRDYDRFRDVNFKYVSTYLQTYIKRHTNNIYSYKYIRMRAGQSFESKANWAKK